jgi:Polyketide cyclase / dehydrase and lipid transport
VVVRIFHTIEIQVPADEVWRVAGRPDLISEFHPAVAEASLEGDLRTCTLLDGSSIVERIVDRSIVHRFYTYELADRGTDFRYRGCLAVRGHGDHTHVDWDLQLDAETDEESSLARRAGEDCGEALDRLRRHLECRLAA